MIFLTGENEDDLVEDFFREVIKKNNINPSHPETFVEMKEMQQRDDFCHLLIVSDKLKAVVVERRNELNYVEYTYFEYN